MEKTLEPILKKLEDIHISLTIMKEAVNTLRDNVAKQNGRVSKLEEAQDAAVSSRATFEERLANHIFQDERSQAATNSSLTDLNKKFDRLSNKVSVGIGILSILSLLAPYLFSKLFH